MDVIDLKIITNLFSGVCIFESKIKTNHMQ